MATQINLSTKAGYPYTYISSETFNIAGIDGYVFVDMSGKRYATGQTATGLPEISLIGVTVSAHRQAPKPRLAVGEHLEIGGTVYEMVFTGRGKYPNNGDLKLVPVQQ